MIEAKKPGEGNKAEEDFNPEEYGQVFRDKVVEKERRKGFTVTRSMRFRYRTRYFTDSGIIGTKAFVFDTYQRFKNFYPTKKDKIPISVSGLGGIYSLKRLSEA